MKSTSVADCKHERVIYINAKADDRQNYSVPHMGIDREGYAPHIDGLCHGDYIVMTVCLDCCTVTGMQPVSDEELYEAFDMEPPGGEDDELLDELGR